MRETQAHTSCILVQLKKQYQLYSTYSKETQKGGGEYGGEEREEKQMEEEDWEE